MARRDSRIRFFHPRLHAPGTAPGTMPTQARSAPATRIRAIGYEPEGFEEENDVSPEKLRKLRGRHPKLWVEVQGAGPEALATLAEIFELHPLLVEDVAHVGQRTKVDQYEDHLFIVLWTLTVERGQVEARQTSIVLGKHFLITFQNHAGSELEPVRQRLARGKGKIRGAGPDYLCYAVIDSIIDHYFPVMEHFSDTIEALESRAFEAADTSVVTAIQDLKRSLLATRKLVWPMREVINKLLREEASELITDFSHPYLRDCQDHTLQVIEITESYRELSSGLMELYLSTVSNRMNEVMKVLTIIATIFIPVTFISSIYGMNFNPESRFNMPELAWRYGYLFALLLMTLCGLGFVVYFRRKGWLGGSRSAL